MNFEERKKKRGKKKRENCFSLLSRDLDRSFHGKEKKKKKPKGTSAAGNGKGKRAITLFRGRRGGQNER